MNPCGRSDACDTWFPRRCYSLPPENHPIVLLHNLAHKHAVDAPKSGSEIRAGPVDETRVALFFAKAHGDIWFLPIYRGWQRRRCTPEPLWIQARILWQTLQSHILVIILLHAAPVTNQSLMTGMFGFWLSPRTPSKSWLHKSSVRWHISR